MTRSTTLDDKSHIWYKQGWLRKCMVGFISTVLAGTLFWIGSNVVKIPPVQSETESNTQEIEEVEKQVDHIEDKVDEEVVPTLRAIDERTKQMNERIE